MNFLKKKPKATASPSAEVHGTAGTLREFVYLDEVSVYSLTSAPGTPPPVTMSESTDSTEGAGVVGQIEGGAPLVAKANVRGELNSSRSRGRQLHRQFNIQSQFARLHGNYRKTFLLTANSGSTPDSEASSLEQALEQLETEQLAIPASKLTRGALTELRVSLRAHHTFDIVVFTRLISDLFKKYPELLQVRDLSGVQTATDVGELLAELMDDLIPIEGRSTAYEIVTDGQGNVWIADIKALHAIWDGEVATEPLRVVGVAETGLFWKDTRRILHADAEFDVLGRISRTGLQDRWTPVKVIDSIRRVVPSVATQLHSAFDELKDITDENPATMAPTAALVTAGTLFMRDLCMFHSVEPESLSTEALSLLADDGTLESKLGALKHIADEFYANHEDLERDENQVGFLRQEAWHRSQVLASPSDDSFDAPSVSETSVLELEFIAMYW